MSLILQVDTPMVSDAQAQAVLDNKVKSEGDLGRLLGGDGGLELGAASSLAEVDSSGGTEVGREGSTEVGSEAASESKSETEAGSNSQSGSNSESGSGSGSNSESDDAEPPLSVLEQHLGFRAAISTSARERAQDFLQGRFNLTKSDAQGYSRTENLI
jgi:hypothetical protein